MESTSSIRPLVSIGMPVFNEERFIGEALQALLAQTLRDFELVVTDNASTDRTSDICREFAARDPRVRYCRSEINIGASANFARVLGLARGRYLLWAGGHDLWDADLIARSVDILEARPEAVIAVAECNWINIDGKSLPRRSGMTDTSGMSSVERLFAVLWGNMHPVLGLIRLDALRRTSGVQSSMGSDLLLLSELALLGDFVFVPGTRWYRREIRPQETYAQMMKRHRSPQYGLVRGIGARFPTILLGARLMAVASRIPLPWHRKLLVWAGMAGTMPARYVGARLRRP